MLHPLDSHVSDQQAGLFLGEDQFYRNGAFPDGVLDGIDRSRAFFNRYVRALEGNLDIIEAPLVYRVFNEFSEPGLVLCVIVVPVVGKVLGVGAKEPVGVCRENGFLPLSQQGADLRAIADAASCCGAAAGVANVTCYWTMSNAVA